MHIFSVKKCLCMVAGERGKFTQGKLKKIVSLFHSRYMGYVLIKEPSD